MPVPNFEHFAPAPQAQEEAVKPTGNTEQQLPAEPEQSSDSSFFTDLDSDDENK